MDRDTTEGLAYIPSNLKVYQVERLRYHCPQVKVGVIPDGGSGHEPSHANIVRYPLPYLLEQSSPPDRVLQVIRRQDEVLGSSW